MARSIEKRWENSYRLTVSEGFDLNGNSMIHRKQYTELKKIAKTDIKAITNLHDIKINGFQIFDFASTIIA